MQKDPYRYFRVEAAELLDNLTRGVLELEKGAPPSGTVASLLRLAHTLKGASQVVKQVSIAQAAHSVEDILGPFRESGGSVAKDQTTQVLHLLDQIGAGLAALDSPAAGTEAAGPARPRETLETVRVEVEEMDGLLGTLAEARIELTGLRGESESLRRVRQLAVRLEQLSRGLAQTSTVSSLQASAQELAESLAWSERRITAGLESAERELGQAHERANRLRLMPAETMFPALARAARETAEALGKRVEFEASGGGVRLDAPVLAVLRDAVMHLVRNAVTHGIETPEERKGAGKSALGRIQVQVERSGNRVTLICRDDGRGMDLPAIRRAAVRKGVISEARAESLSLKEAIALILEGGLSTSEVTGFAGRGIGLDVVRDAVTRLKGAVEIETVPGQGTTVKAQVPVSLAASLVLLVEGSGAIAAIPLESVRETLRLESGAISDAGTGATILYGGHAVPYLRMPEAWGRSNVKAGGLADGAAVIIEAGGTLAALGVERLLGTSTVLVRSVPALAGVEPVIGGAALDAEGNPVLVFDPEVLAVEVQRVRNPAPPPAGKRQEPILIIDDSLTTRMVEQSVLESAGHRVECAASAEEALEKAHQRRYSLFLVDVEMPGLDGYQFVSAAKQDPQLREIPSILVTSRGSAADRQRGVEAGARAYIVKSEFDQTQFLETVRRLVA